MIAQSAYREGRPPRASLAALPLPKPRPLPSGTGAWVPPPSISGSGGRNGAKVRRRLALVLILILSALAAVSAAACAPAAGAPAKAFLVLGVSQGAEGSARGFLPADIVLSSIRVEGSGPSGLAVSAESAVQPSEIRSFDFELKPGSWAFRASGYNSEKIEIATGLLNLSLAPGQRAKGNLLLVPSQGSGSLSLSWTLLASLTPPLEVSGSLKPGSGAPAAIQSSFEASPLRIEGLAAGRYELELRLRSAGTEVCGLADTILIAAGMETSATVFFDPPAAKLGISTVLPIFSAGDLEVAPLRRRIAAGRAASFRAAASEPLSWYLEGNPLPGTGWILQLPVFTEAGQRHVDCLATGLPGNHGRTLVDVGESMALGPLSWVETLVRDDEAASSAAYAKGLGDCRGLAWSADGSYMAIAGKDTDAISLIETGSAGASFVVSSIGGSSEPRLAAPSSLKFLPDGSILALSDTAGAAYSLGTVSGTLSFRGQLADPALAGAADLVIAQSGTQAYVAAAASNTVTLLGIGADGSLPSAAATATQNPTTLPDFAAPSCIALDPTESLIAVGTKGDDAIYLFSRTAPSGELSLSARIDADAFAAFGTLSDPCSLAFSPDGNSLYVLSYYGKTVFRLDKDPVYGTYALVAGAKSGSGSVTGFATPKRLALSPDGTLLAIVGSGAADGLALFDTTAPGALAYSGALLPGSSDALPARPCFVTFSPQGGFLAVAADGRLSLFELQP
jgi:DNA-binding beta-propeller fold protein YncE